MNFSSANQLEKRRESVRRCYHKNKVRYAPKKGISNHKRYVANKETFRIKNRACFLKHQEQLLEKQRQYRLKNLEACRARAGKWYQDHKDDPVFKLQRASKGKKFYEENKSRFAKEHKRWRQNNKGYFPAMRLRRRLLEKNATRNLAAIKKWMKAVRAKRVALCYYCQKSITSSEIHFDHIVAISRGGQHSVENLCVSCKSCNLRKQDKPISAWVRVGQQVLSL